MCRQRPIKSPVKESQAAPTGPDRRCGVGLQRLGQQLVVDVPEVGGGFEVAVVEVGEAGLVAVEPPLTGAPATNTGPAVPWSVPCEALAFTRRPNSEYASSTTFLPYRSPAICCRNGVTASSSVCSWRCWVPRSLA